MEKGTYWNEGDIGVFISDKEQVQRLQKNHGGWIGKMEEAFGKSVVVTKRFPDGDLKIKFQTYSWLINPKCLEKLPDINMGDEKIIINDEAKLKELQEGHGGWSNLMKLSMGQKVEIIHVLEDGDCYVSYKNMEWMINPKCFLDTSASISFNQGDIVEVDNNVNRVKQLQKDHGGWISALEQFCGQCGTVETLLPNGDIRVKFNKKLYVFNPRCLKAIHEKKLDVNFEIGDRVRMIKDLKTVKELQKDHGEWVQGMELFLGERGEVLYLFPDGDLRIRIMSKEITINPDCCFKLSDTDEPQNEKEILRPVDQQISRNKEHVKCENIAASVSDMKTDFIRYIKEGNFDQVEKLVDKIGVNTLFNHFTSCHFAANEGYDDILRLFIRKGANLNIADDDGDTALHIAVLKNHNKCVEAILDSCTVPNHINNKGYSPLMLAVSLGYKDIVETLLKSKYVQINCKSDLQGTALHVAINNNLLEEVELLLNKNADCEILNEAGFSSIHFAALIGNERILEKILEKGPPALVDSQKEDGFAAVHVCAINNHLSCMQLLIDKNADLNIGTHKKQTALHLAVSQKYLDMVKLLVENKADPNLKDGDGDTPLHDAITSHSIETIKKSSELKSFSHIVESLTENLKGSDSFEEIALYLVKSGAKMNITNSSGKMALDVCGDQNLKSKLCQLMSDQSMTIRSNSTRKREQTNLEREIEELRNQYENERLCKICYAKNYEVAFDCGHMTCESCSKNICECHVCRSHIDRRIKLYN